MTIIARNLVGPLLRAAGHYPVATVTGPRQSGKTTLCRATFPEHAYVSLEPLDTRAFATTDPRAFLGAHAGGAILDEIQNVPSLPSYIQSMVDDDPTPGRFILTGSQHLGLSTAVSQSLAGRTAILHLWPLGYDEVLRFPTPPNRLWDAVWQGGYPRIHDQGIPADDWLANYATTYLERDVRTVLEVANLTAFSSFLRLAAASTAQALNLSALGADAGVSHNTARSWLSVLETTFVCQRLSAWHRNARKRLVKSPKLHFVDSGLACHLLGIQSAAQLEHHPLRGALFETWVAGEVAKARIHRGLRADLFHYRETRGIEVDLVVEAADRIILVEVKSGATVASDWLAPLARLRDEMVAAGEQRAIELRVLYGGDEARQQLGVKVVPWWGVAAERW